MHVARPYHTHSRYGCITMHQTGDLQRVHWIWMPEYVALPHTRDTGFALGYCCEENKAVLAASGLLHMPHPPTNGRETSTTSGCRQGLMCFSLHATVLSALASDILVRKRKPKADLTSTGAPSKREGQFCSSSVSFASRFEEGRWGTQMAQSHRESKGNNGNTSEALACRWVLLSEVRSF